MTTTIKPIETAAFGRRFRSRLEARYAVFLTTLGLRWEYEPEGFQLPSGWYLPDFYLPDIRGGTWLEIKPHGQGSFGWGKGSRWTDRRLYDFADAHCDTVHWGQFFVANGLPDPAGLSGDYAAPGLLEAPWDPHLWCVCPCGLTVGIEFDGRGGRIDCERCGTSIDRKCYSHDHPRIIAAAVAAHSARFEHGERHD